MKKILLGLFVSVFLIMGAYQVYAAPLEETITRTLKEGMKGSDVSYLQSYLGIPADGYYGPQTTTNVKNWQTLNGLSSDGIFGPGSFTKLYQELMNQNEGSVLGETADSTPRIMYWVGKVNQHISTDGTGIWRTDGDGRSGATIDKLTYCKKWFPNTVSVEPYLTETITTWQTSNTSPMYTGTKISDKCVQPTSTSASSTTLTPINGGWSNWYNSGSCVAGSQKQIRYCTNPAPANGGATCSGLSTQTISCNFPIIQTTRVYSITQNSAIVGLEVASLGSPAANSPLLIYYGTTPHPTTSYVTHPNSLSVKIYEYKISNLTCGTKYYYYGSIGSTYSTDGTFTTSHCDGWVNPNIPVVSSPSVSSIGSDRATFGGIITSPSAPITEYGVCVKKGTEAYGCIPGSTPKTGSFSINRQNLIPGTTYSYKLYAETATEQGYSTEGTFTTLPTSAAVNGGWSLWQNSGSCINNKQVQTRLCNNPSPINGGTQCVGSSSQSVSCTVTTPSITISSPVGGETFKAGQQVAVKWKSDLSDLGGYAGGWRIKMMIKQNDSIIKELVTDDDGQDVLTIPSNILIGNYILEIGAKYDSSGGEHYTRYNTIPFTIASSTVAFVNDYVCGAPLTEKLESNMSGGQVNALQKILNGLGYLNTTSVDGKFGTATYNAVVAFQKSKSLSPDGIVGVGTRTALNEKWQDKCMGGDIETPSTPKNICSISPLISNLLLGQEDSQVKILQSTLSQLGYYSKTPNGTYDYTTSDSVKDFQKANGLYSNGLVNTETRTKINAKWQEKCMGDGDVDDVEDSIVTVGAPTVIAPSAYFVLSDKAILKANITSLGTPASVIDRGVCYAPISETKDVTLENKLNNTPNDINCLQNPGVTTNLGSYDFSISNLKSNTDYKFRAFAKNETGTSYSSLKTFKTLTVGEISKCDSKISTRMGRGHASSSRNTTLQSILKGLGYPLDIDGRFGGITEFYVKKFQADNGLVIDGIVGSVTMNFLNQKWQSVCSSL